jgi:hypothetical protein
MPLNFPDNPNVDDLYIFNNVTFKWDGVKWTPDNASFITETSVATLTNKTLTSAVIDAGYTEETFPLSGNANVVLDPTNGGIQTHTLTANTSYVDSINTGEALTLLIDDGNAFTVTWPDVTWSGNTAPTLAATGVTGIELWKVSETLYGLTLGNYGATPVVSTTAPEISLGGSFFEGNFGTTTSTATGSLSVGSAPVSGEKRYIIATVGVSAVADDESVAITSLSSNTSGSLTEVESNSILVTSSFGQAAGLYYYEFTNGNTTDQFVVSHTSRGAVAVTLYAVYVPNDQSISVVDNQSATVAAATSVQTPSISSGEILVGCAQVRNGSADPTGTSLTGPGNFDRKFAGDASGGDENHVSGYATDTSGFKTVTDATNTQEKVIVGASFNFT